MPEPSLSAVPVAPQAGTALFAVAVSIALLLQTTGSVLDGSLATIAACVALLVFGLPHGASDIAVIFDDRPAGGLRWAFVLVAYLAVAGVMYALWRFSSAAALSLFLVAAVLHFSEDWRASGLRLTAIAAAAALVGAPALLHRPETSAIFVALTGDPTAARLADGLNLLAPVAMALATLGFLLIWVAGRRAEAIGGVIALVAMVLLPPVVGFTLFFCLSHSPAHLSVGLAHLRVRWGVRAGGIVAGLTLLALGLAALIYIMPTTGSSPSLIYTSFVTLSVLTLPHLAAPSIVHGIDALFGIPKLAERRLDPLGGVQPGAGVHGAMFRVTDRVVGCIKTSEPITDGRRI